MADTLDVISLAEAKRALNIEAADTSQDTELASYITAVSRRLDEKCGAIVKRTVTDEEYPGGTGMIVLRQAPASPNASTTISTVTEYSGGSAQVLTAEALTTSTAYDYAFDAKTGMISRRSTWTNATFGLQRVKITYSAGRYADTASVDQKFKQAAAIMLSHLWRAEQGVGGSATFGGADESGPHYGLMDAQVDILLEGEFLPPGF